MTADPLWVDAVDIRRAPGFDAGGFPVDDLCSGINVIHGPNASGKTTMARSIQWLLWPDDASDRASITGRVAIDGEQWRIDVDRGRARYQRDGQDANSPSLPQADQQDRYVLSLHELLQHETRDESFARAIKRETAGGYDLSAAVKALDFDSSPTSRRKREVTAAESAIEDWREAKRTIEALREEQRRLPRLERKREAARAAQQRVTLLEQAIEYAKARERREMARERLDEFPDRLHDLDGDEAETVAELDERIETWRTKQSDAAAELDAAKQQRDQATLPDEGLPDGFIDQLTNRRDTLDTLADRLREQRAALTDFESQRDRAREDIPIDVSEADLTSLDPDAWEDLTSFARQAERVSADRELKAAVEQWLVGDDRPDQELQTLERGQQALEQWLAHPPVEAGETDRSMLAVGVGSAVLLGVAGIALGLLVNPAGYLLVLAGGGLCWYAYRSAKSGVEGDESRALHRETYEELGLESPSSWSEADVRGQLSQLTRAIASHRIADEREQRWQARTSEVDALEQRESALEETRQALREQLGAAPGTTDVELVATTEAICRWQEANDRVCGLEEKIATVEEQIEETRSRLQDELEPYGYDDVTDAATATQFIRDLENRGREQTEADRASAPAEETIEEAQTTIEDLESRREAVFEAVGLASDESERLRDLCEQIEAFEEAKRARDDAAVLAEKEQADLEAFPEFEPALLDRPVAELEREKREAEATASTTEERQKEITEIEKAIDDAKRDSRIEEALTEKDRAIDALADQLHRDYDAMVGDVLADHVRDATTDANRPAVFDHARDVLARISTGRYRLDLDVEGDTFRAYDTVKQRGFALDELSSATRLQVLLAVRIAFVERHEQGTRLPILLDETLANTDDRKADVIIESMIELARDGRQLFYFTAQGDEVAKWLAAVEDAEDVDHAVIDLGDVQGLDRHVDVPALNAITTRSGSPPSPDGHDHGSYGTVLDVPPFDPRRGAGAAHLWYVVEDVDLLHRLLDLGIERWGQLENVLTNASGTVIADEDRLDAVTCTGNALEEFVWSWQKGRGKRVDRDVLEATPAVTKHFIDDVTALAKDLDGDGERIIEALRNGRVDRFRAHKADELEAFLKDEGYIESIDPLTPEGIRVRVIDCLVENGVPREQASERGQRLLDRLATSVGE